MQDASFQSVEETGVGSNAKLFLIRLPKDSELNGILCHSATGFHSVALFALREVGRCRVFISRQGHHSGQKNRPQILPCGRQPYEAPSPNPGGAPGEVTPLRAGLSDKFPAMFR
jgi:hypothetical protein